MIKTSVLALVAFLVVTTAPAADVMYGAGTLPKLAGEAQLVVEVKEISIAKQTDKAIIFAVTSTKPWKGAPPAGPLLVLCPTVEGAPLPEDLINAAVFLRGPLTGGQRRFWGIDSQMGDVYQLVGGRRGIVSFTGADARRRIALMTYLMAADGTENARLAWAQKNVRNTDLFLQESALFELERQTDKQATLMTLSQTISSGQPSSTAAYAVTIVGDSKLPEAVGVLVRVATNKKLTGAIRRQAVIELMERPDGATSLEKLVSNDAFVAATVKTFQEN